MTVAGRGLHGRLDDRLGSRRERRGRAAPDTDTTQAEYLKLSSTVTSPATAQSRSRRPACSRPEPASSAPPPERGRASDRSQRRAGRRRPRQPDRARSSPTARTLGCAVFGYIPLGHLQVQVTARNPGERVAGHRRPDRQRRPSEPRADGDRAAGVAAGDLRASDRQHVRPGGQRGLEHDHGRQRELFPSGKKAVHGRYRKRRRRRRPTSSRSPDGCRRLRRQLRRQRPQHVLSNYFVPGGRGYTALQPGDALRP